MLFSFWVEGVVQVQEMCGGTVYDPRWLTRETLADLDEAAGIILETSGYGQIVLDIDNSVEKAITYQVSRLVKRQNVE